MILSRERQSQIESIINDMLSSIGLYYPKNSLFSIAESVGTNVFLFNFDENIRGAIDYEVAGSKPRIYINKNLGKSARRFALAHELGHFVLHTNEDKFLLDKFDYSVNSRESKQETEANFFAATLLMPVEELVAVLGRTADILSAAQHFGVSPLALKNRILWLRRNRNLRNF